jgi:hypothetical protein
MQRDNILDKIRSLEDAVRILQEHVLDTSGIGSGTDLVSVSSNDLLPGTLMEKLVAGIGVAITEIGNGEYETLGIDIEAHISLPNAHHNPVTVGNGLSLATQQVSLTTPGSLTATSPNTAVGSHTHAIDATIARSAITITAGNGLTGGGNLTGNRTINVVAGNGLTVSADSIALTTPGSLTVSSTNTAVGNHTHAVTASSTPNGTATLLKTDSAGRLQYVELQHSTIGVPGEAADTSVVMTFNHRNQLANAGLIGTATYSVNGGTAVPLGNNPFDGSSSYVSIAAVAGDDIEIIVEIPTLVSNYGSAKWHPLVAVRNPLNNLTSLQPSTIEAFVSNDGITWYYPASDGWKTTSPETEWKLGGRLWLGTSAVPTLPVALPGYTWRYAKFVLGDLVGGTSYAYVWLAHLGMIHTSHPGIPDFIGPNGGSIYNRLSFLTPSIGSTTANAYIDEDGSAKFGGVVLTGNIQTDNYVSRATGWQVSYAGEADFRNIFADTLEVQTFIVDNVLATAGTEILTKSLSTLSRDFTIAVWGIIYVFDLPGSPDVRVFADGDTIRLRSIDRTAGLIVSDVYGRVSNYTNLADGEQSYEFDKVSGTDGLVIYAGSTVLDYGESGDGFIISTVADTYSPYTDVRTWATTIDNDTTHLRVGQLQGITAVNEYGIVAKISSQQQLIASDGRVEIHGAKLSLYQSATETLRLDPAVPSLAIGNPLPAFGDEGIWAGLHSGDYKFRVGNAVDYVLWDGTLLTVAGKMLVDGDSQFVGPVSLASGGGIYQGTGTFASPTTGLKLWNDGGIGKLAGFNGGVEQAGFNTSGKLTAGAGIVILDDSGITINKLVLDTDDIWTEAYSFKRGDGLSIGGLKARIQPTNNIIKLSVAKPDGTDGVPYISLLDTSLTAPDIKIYCSPGSNDGKITLLSPTVWIEAGYTANPGPYVRLWEATSVSRIEIDAKLIQFGLSSGTSTVYMRAGLSVGGVNQSPLNGEIYAGNGIYVHSGATVVGALTASDTTWLRINQDVAKNIYTPQAIVAATGLSTYPSIPAAGCMLYHGDLYKRYDSVNYVTSPPIPLATTPYPWNNLTWTSANNGTKTLTGVPTGVKYIIARLQCQPAAASSLAIGPYSGPQDAVIHYGGVAGVNQSQVVFIRTTSNTVYASISGTVASIHLIVLAYGF